MIKKLRKDIILLNMLLVGVVMLVICTAVCVSSYSSSKENLLHGLNQVLVQNDKDDKQPYGIKPPDNTVIGKRDPGADKAEAAGPGIGAYVLVETDSSGNVTNVENVNASVDDDELEEITALAVNGDDSGELFEHGLMYAKTSRGDTVQIVFADTSTVYSTLRKTIFTALALFAGGIIILFVISLGLSYLAVKPVKEAWLRQKQFVADASHELKTPLTVILANNNILMSHGEATIGSERKWLESTDEEAKHMKKLIDQMLFLAKSDAGQTVGEFTSVNLSEITEGTVLNFEPVAYESSTEISSEIDCGLFVNGDETMLTQLTHILVDNAVKYAGENGCVGVRLKKTADGCTLEVNNSGEVISKEDLPHLFDRFYRTDKARGKGGYGLGLSIADNIAKTHGAKISVESTEQDGTTFSVKFQTLSKV